MSRNPVYIQNKTKELPKATNRQIGSSALSMKSHIPTAMPLSNRRRIIMKASQNEFADPSVSGDQTIRSLDDYFDQLPNFAGAMKTASDKVVP